MFDINIAGLRELEGGKPPHRLVFEPIANVFDEYRRGAPLPPAEETATDERTRAIDLDEPRRRPTFCKVAMSYSSESPHGVWVTVTDDGPGFANESDIWTIFGTTSKRDNPQLAGRFNFGEKQLIAMARKAQVCTRFVCVTFEGGKRDIKRFREKPYEETTVTALMPWSLGDLVVVRSWLQIVRPPAGLRYILDDVERTFADEPRYSATIVLPTVCLRDGVMRDSLRRTRVDVFKTEKPMLYELGMPICDIEELGFPWSLDVQQKIPLPMSRDFVSPTYLLRLLGLMLEEAALECVQLLSPEEQGASFIKGALDWIREPQALRNVVEDLYGPSAVRVSSDALANAQAASVGAPLISGREFTAETRRRLDDARALPSSKVVFGGADPEPTPTTSPSRCRTCGRPF